MDIMLASKAEACMFINNYDVFGCHDNPNAVQLRYSYHRRGCKI